MGMSNKLVYGMILIVLAFGLLAIMALPPMVPELYKQLFLIIDLICLFAVVVGLWKR